MHRQQISLVVIAMAWLAGGAPAGRAQPVEFLQDVQPILTRSPGHMLDWVRACKGGEASCSDFAITGPYAEWLAMISIAYRVPGKLNWDAKGLRFTNSPEATALVRPVFRRGWELKL